MVQLVTATERSAPQSVKNDAGLGGNRIVGFMLAHEQFGVPDLLKLAETAAQSGFDPLAMSDHTQL
jgi:hypothetical protein